MKRQRTHPDIYQLRIVLRGISPLIWRRVLVHGDTTLAQLHEIIQILFDWRDEHLHDFHIYGKDYGTGGADTQGVTLSQFQFRKGERFRYVYDYGCPSQTDELSTVIKCSFTFYNTLKMLI